MFSHGTPLILEKQTNKKTLRNTIQGTLKSLYNSENLATLPSLPNTITETDDAFDNLKCNYNEEEVLCLINR